MTVNDTYSYFDAEKEDILNYILENEKNEDYSCADEMVESLIDRLWNEDSITGNVSGSYTCSRAEARACVLPNLSLLKAAVEEYAVQPDEVGKWFLDEDWESMDVLIRCYILYQCVDSVVAALVKSGELYFENEE